MMKTMVLLFSPCKLDSYISLEPVSSFTAIYTSSSHGQNIRWTESYLFMRISSSTCLNIM
ncbi:hypothetical protein Mapa_016089 [Marchantia paleacea]|nr:hypothetical protein Mapa_016089 [Marchantia paleacea]